ncbi:MAG: hypothetical protein M3P33_02300 [bacterium]|nr:hypothetical protein [bacterium]
MTSKFDQLKKVLTNQNLMQIKTPFHPGTQAPLEKAIAEIKQHLIGAVAKIEQEQYSSDDSKYFSLLLECQKAFLKTEEVSLTFPLALAPDVAEQEQLEFHSNLLEVLNHNVYKSVNDIATPVTKDDILFANLYLICEEIFTNDQVKGVLSNIIKGNKTTKDGNIVLADMTYDAFIQPNLTEDKRKRLMNILISVETNTTTMHDICIQYYILKKQDLTVNLEDSYRYKALARKNKNYTKYRDSLIPLSKIKNDNSRLHHSNKMNAIMDILVNDTNKLYLDANVTPETKDECANLLEALGQVVGDIAKVRSVQNFKYNLVDNIDQKQDYGISELSKSVTRQAKIIERMIANLSKKTSTLNWSRILLVAIITLGIGIIGIKQSLNSGSMFFKKEHPIVHQARNLIKQGEEDIKLTNLSKPSQEQGEQDAPVSIAFEC